MTWYFRDTKLVCEIIPSKSFGFVYEITNLISGRKYIGQKQFFFYTSKIENKNYKNGKSKKIKVKNYYESDWRSYYGSSTDLNSDLKLYGIENFSREIIKICYSKNELNYFETKMIMLEEALESNQFYNKWSNARITKLVK